MLDLTFQVNGAKPEVLEELAKAVDYRHQALRESSQDALVAITINTLKSLRKQTRARRTAIKLDNGVKDKLSISLTRCNDMKVGFCNDDMKYCIRSISGEHLTNIKPWWQVPPFSNLRMKANVYKIELSGDRTEAWRHQRRVSYLVAVSDESAKEIVEARFGRIVKRYETLGKSTLGNIMSRVSTRPVKLESNNQKALKVVNIASVVNKVFRESEGEFYINIKDDLRYALDALEGGANALNFAMMRSVNSAVGYVNKMIDTNHYYQRWTELNGIQKRPRPFPEEMFDPEGAIV